MEGKKVYEDSLEELKRLETAGQLKRSMYQIISKRKHEVESVIMNTNVEV